MINDKIPFLDLNRQHKNLKRELFQIFDQVYDSSAFSHGPFVVEFEKQFSTFCNTKHAIALNNGTSSLHLAISALDIGKGDEVIVPANTFIATAWGVSYSGATPVFTDCDPDTWEIDTRGLEKKISKKTKAIIGVHLYGQPFDIEPVSLICKENNLYLIEDAAQAQGAKYKGKIVGGFGEMACFSFYPGKNLGACGEAGAITTNNSEYCKIIESLRNHGTTVRYYHDRMGHNMRMGGFEGASLTIKLKYLENWNNRRKEIAGKYQRNIVNSKINMQAQPLYSDSIYHLFVITTENREKLLKHLNDCNIFPGLHYPVPCHLQKAYSHLNYKKGDLPNAEYLAEHCLSLPMFPELTDEEIARVICAVNSF